jgi:hypothetical protein
MTEMKFGDTQIKVQPHKVDEMLRKGWEVVQAEQPVAKPKKASKKVVQDTDSGEE